MRDSNMLSEQQVTYFRTFGFLKLPGVFTDAVGDMSAGFDEIFTDDGHPRIETHEVLHGEQRRLMIPNFVDRSSHTRWLRDDDRVAGIVGSLLDDYEYAESDGNILDCETSWHCDIFGAPMDQRHLKLLFYLDPQRADSGALRVMPGTQNHRETFARTVRSKANDPRTIIEEFGLERADLPSFPIETDPGDVIALDFRTLHASFHGVPGRRLFTMNFRERAAVSEPAAS